MTLSKYKYDAELLRPWMLEQLQVRGVASNVAHHVVCSVIETSLRGVDSHGINLFPHYSAIAASGRINLSPKMSFTRKSPALGSLDADWTYGHHAGAIAMQRAQEMAIKTGFGLINVQNSSHFGAAAYFALLSARAGFVSFVCTNADSLVKAHNAVEPFFGTNPICFAAPMENEDPLCLDMATSAVPWNKVKNYQLENKPLEADWAFDKEGFPVIDPNSAVSLAPTGSYKGFGLGLMVEVLCSVLVGGPIGKEIPPMYQDISKRREISHCFAVLDISKMNRLSLFTSQITSMVARIRSMRKLGEEEVMVPGDPQKKAFAERRTVGIPVSDMVHEKFRDISSTIEVVLRK